MRRNTRRILILAVALFVFALSIAPGALRATHWRHACNHTNCPVCTAIRDDLAALHILAVAAITALVFYVALLHIQITTLSAPCGFGIFTPIENKVRMNN